MIFMLRLFKKIFKLKPRTIPSQTTIKPIIERQILVSKNKKANISPTITKRMVHRGGNIDAVVKNLVRKINRLHQKQVKYGLSKKEIILLAESQKYLERVTATREGTKKIFVED